MFWMNYYLLIWFCDVLRSEITLFFREESSRFYSWLSVLSYSIELCIRYLLAESHHSTFRLHDTRNIARIENGLMTLFSSNPILVKDAKGTEPFIPKDAF